MATPYYACVRCAARALGPGGKPRDDSGGVARAAGAPLNVQRLDEAGVFLDEGEAQLRLAPHELLDQLGRLFLLCAGILVGRAGDGDPQQRAPARVHGGFLELLGRHLAEALEAARSEEHTSALQSLMRISYAVFCLKK